MYKKFTILLFALIGSTILAYGQSLPVHGQPMGHEEPVEKALKVYPNPATTQVTFEFVHSNEGSFELIVYNFLGKRVEDIKNFSNKHTVDLNSRYYSGIYIYQLRDSKGSLIESGKFNVIKQ